MEYPLKKSKNRIEQTPKTREKKTLALEKQQEVPLIRMEKGAENNFKKENFFVLERCLNMISHFRYPIFLLYYKRISDLFQKNKRISNIIKVKNSSKLKRIDDVFVFLKSYEP